MFDNVLKFLAFVFAILAMLFLCCIVAVGILELWHFAFGWPS